MKFVFSERDLITAIEYYINNALLTDNMRVKITGIKANKTQWSGSKEFDNFEFNSEEENKNELIL